MKAYQLRIFKVMDYVNNHLDEQLNLNQLSKIAGTSNFHFHRVFRAFTGLTPAAYVKQQRLHRVATQLAYRQHKKIIDIALENGFSTGEAMYKVFKQVYGVSPSRFALYPDFTRLDALKSNPTSEEYSTNMLTLTNLEIVQFEQVDTACMMHRGSPETIGKTLYQFIQWRKRNGLSPDKSRTFNLHYDDPRGTAASEYRVGLCAETLGTTEANGFDVKTLSIPEGRCIRIQHTGADYLIAAKLDYVLGEYMSLMDLELRDFPIFFERISFYPEVPETELRTDVYIPID